MVEEFAMSSPPEDELEKLFAAEESAISDDGFSRRVIEQTGKELAWRRTAIYGAGLTGLGFALGGIFEIAPHLPDVSAWFGGLTSAVQLSDLGGAVQGASDGTQMAVVAVLAGLTCLITAVSLQSR
jgi:hypothetical protein